MLTYKIHLIRNGSASDGDWKGYLGQSNRPLSDAGAAELQQLRRELEYPMAQMVFASPLQRCVQTADILYPDTYAVCKQELTDLGLGEFEGLSVDELREDPAYAAWLQNSLENPPPGGEDIREFTARIILAVREIFQQMMDESLNSVAVITHGGVIMSLLAGIGLPKLPMHQWSVGHGTGYTLLFTPQMWMRDGCAEVYTQIPQPPAESGGFFE